MRAATLVCHCLLVEAPDGLVLVDTGIGLLDIARPAARLGRQFLRRVRPVLDPDETALRQVIGLGYAPYDVRHIVLTHLDRDHVGGLADFPTAQVHVYGPALQAARHPATRRDRDRHRGEQWSHGPRWHPHEYAGGERWLGFEAVRALPGLPEDVLLVPLAGHSTGHVGVAVLAGDGAAERWLLHAGDAYFFHGETEPDHPYCPAGLRLFQRKAQACAGPRLDSQAQLRDLRGVTQVAQPQVTVFSAHDAAEFRQLH